MYAAQHCLRCHAIAGEGNALRKLDESHGPSRRLDLAQDAMIEAGRRDVVAETAEILAEMALDRAGQGLGALGNGRAADVSRPHRRRPRRVSISRRTTPTS